MFLLTKSERYFYDINAIREGFADARQGRDGGKKGRERNVGGRTDGYTRPNNIDPSGNGGRNMRTVWTIPTAPFPGAHFATFGEKLVEPMIKAGSSEGGCCAKCGTPRERVIETGEPLAEQRAACGADATGGYSGESTKDHAANGVQDASAVKARVLAGMVTKRTVGWASGCKCEGSIAPCVVLDPFCGSGTVGAVCMREGRDFIGIELFEENVKMARERIADPDYAKKVRKAQRERKKAEREAPVCDERPF